jgi:succinate dehydrogenase/fumarate reductase flavoprotein subunit
MNLKHKMLSNRKLTTSITAAAIALAIGGYAIVDATSSNGASGSANASSAAKVIPFQAGQPGASKTVGQVPTDFNPGTGTIVTGTAADKAKAAALAAYPGGTVNRVVLLSDGEYNVHIIAVNWPHHVFVSQDFKVVGAE